MVCYKSLAVTMFVLLSSVTWVSATVYVVGDNTGWAIGVDYSNWLSGKTFAVGDILIFNYATGAHTVTEVSSSDYSSCSTINAISSSNNGPTKITLTSGGTRFFICGVPGHCSKGQKIQVTVGSSSSAAPGSSSSSSNNNDSGSVRLGPFGPIVMILVSLGVIKLGYF